MAEPGILLAVLFAWDHIHTPARHIHYFHIAPFSVVAAINPTTRKRLKYFFLCIYSFNEMLFKALVVFVYLSYVVDLNVQIYFRYVRLICILDPFFLRFQ